MGTGAEQGLWSACQVGNFRVEPPGLFRGRGDHPKMGKFKRRIFPRDITINIGARPLPPYPTFWRSTSPLLSWGMYVSKFQTGRMREQPLDCHMAVFLRDIN